MNALLIPQEIFLLERYSSLEYFGDMRDHFAAMVEAAQDGLHEFMKHIPADYRSWHTSQQPDVVWGERVIPNMQWVLDGLNKGYIRISHDDLNALGLASNVQTTFDAINRDYPYDWMPQPHQDEFDARWLGCGRPKSNISIRSLANWCTGDLSTGYEERLHGPLGAPASWPQYRINPQVRVKTDDKVRRNGIYLPDAGDSCAQLLIEGCAAWGATVLRDPGDPNNQTFDRVPTTWTIVERVGDIGNDIPGIRSLDTVNDRLRCEASQPCPRAGWWFTPAGAARRYFEHGEVMSEVKSDYGVTIWQWDERQG